MSFWIAIRYFFSRQIFSLVNVVSLITLVSVIFITASMILVLSIFNGFSNYHQEIVNKCYPDLKIEHASLSSFNSAYLLKKIDSFHKDSLINYIEVLEREIIIQYTQKNSDYGSYIDKNSYSIIKGVGNDFNKIYTFFSPNSSDNNKISLIDSDFTDSFNKDSNLIYVGQNVASRIDLQVYNPYNFNQKLRVWYLNSHNGKPKLSFSDSFKTSSIFKLGENTFDNIIFADINKIRNLFNCYQTSYIEIAVKNKNDLNKIKNKIQNEVGSNYIVKNRIQQTPLIFKIIQTEKLVIYIIFFLIIIITMVTLIGSMLILINQKKNDISILFSLGYSLSKVRSVFTFLGLLIVFVGFFIGSILGYILCLIQQSSSFLKLETPNGVIAYPVQIDVYDFSIIMSLILSIGFIISIIVTRIVFSPKKN